ncbi:MAG: stage II sporulation protein D [Ruminococcus sp.]|nr:stage II sporulation protein D [Ruminococcus sp.]
MNRYLASLLTIAIGVTVIPALPVYLSGRRTQPESPVIAGQAQETAGTDRKCFRVLDIASGEILAVPLRDYLIGAAAAEMPVSFEPEALKAQIVAAHTYALRQCMREETSPTPELRGADFSNDTSRYQGYFTESRMRSCYGSTYDESVAKLSAAVDEVMPYVLTYGGEPIIAAFHSMSPGRTESAGDVWGTPVDYLVPVDSPADTSAPRYMEEARFPEPVLRKRLTDAFPGIDLGSDPAQWITVRETTQSGTVLTALAGDRSVTGNELREALGLRSACFTVAGSEDGITVTTRGFGHGVGLSQYGADAMAAEGSSWREILEHYYPGCTIEAAAE